VIYAYCTREGVSEDLYELTPVMKKLRMMVEDMHINLLLLSGNHAFDEGMVSEPDLNL